MSKIMELNESMEPTFDQLSIDLISNTVLAYNIHIYHFWDVSIFLNFTDTANTVNRY